MKKRIIRMAAAILAAILFFTTEVCGISAKSAILIDARTGRVLYEKNADSRSLIASTTKIMTALVICEQCNVLDRMRIPKEAVGIEGSSMYLREGEILTIQELLYGLMLQSGNDAAVALAIYCGGTVGGFVELMNDKARLLGMYDTHFENPNGLDSPDHYSTARDLAKLTCFAMDNPIFAQTVGTKTFVVGSRHLRNHNKLLWQLKGADGVKTGFTKAAGRVLVSSAQRQGRRLVTVTINAPSDWQDHMSLMNAGFEEYKIQRIVNTGDILGMLEVESGTKRSVLLAAACDYDFAIRNDENISVKLQNAAFAYAPVLEGQQAGYAYIYIDDAVVGKVPVVYSETVELEEANIKPFWKRIFRGE